MKQVGLSILFVLLLCAGVARGQESKIHALFVLKFVENVSWPQDRKNVVIGVVGKSEILAEIEARLKVKNANGVVVKKISAAEANTCDVVYLPSSEDKNLNAVITASAAGTSVLVITESDFSTKGSGISFFEEAGKLRFAINKNVLDAKGLKVSGALLSLGKQV